MTHRLPPDLSSAFRASILKAAGVATERSLKVVNETSVPFPWSSVRWVQDVYEDRKLAPGRIRILPWTPDRPFGETLGATQAVVYASTDSRITPLTFLESNIVHEIRHLEQNQREWLIDDEARNELIAKLLRSEGLTTPDSEFFNRHHAVLPEEVDAFTFEMEVSGFNGQKFARALDLAMEGRGPWPDPERFRVPGGRRIQR